MKFLLVIIIFIIICYCIWQKLELGKFEVNTYDIKTKKVSKSKKIALIADLHSHVYGKNNDILIEKLKEMNPDLILIPGDLIVSKKVEKYAVAYELISEISKIAPIYFSNGNHESRLKKKDHPCKKEYLKFEESLFQLGVHILNNESLEQIWDKDEFCIHGLDLDLDYYAKGKTKEMKALDMEGFLGKLEKENQYHILLAHNPAYCKQYAMWGADLTVCGHNHGGLIRLPNGRSFISPQFKLFPKYDAGHFIFENNKNVVISRGLGTHTFHIRIFNRAELVQINIISDL